MNARIMVTLTRDDVNKNIPYAMICSVRYGARWNTLRRKKLWAEQFTEAEKKKAYTMFRQSHLWYLVRGVPDEVVMSAGTLALWKKLGDFCGNL